MKSDADSSDQFQLGLALAIAAGGLVVGIILSAFVGALVIATGDYLFDVPGGPGAALGRAVAQDALSVPIETRVIPLSLVALLQVPLWVGLVGAPLLASKLFGEDLFDGLKLRFRRSDIPTGLAIGAAAQLIAVPAIYLPLFKLLGERDLSADARSLTDRANDPLGIVILVLVVVVGAPVVEEIFFRGFLQTTLERRIGSRGAWLIASAVFAVVHFQVLQFPALFMFGLLAGFIYNKYDRLGPAIWTHVGFNAVTVMYLVFL
ncbi:MAG: type II CAAX endopeptidase family protein [Acidimicrobiales bacterium]